MSSLIVSHDLHIMMMELAVEKLYVPRTSVFDSAILKKTTVMFRLLDDEWTALYPYRSDYRQYRGSNYESEPFHGGKSIVFSLPEASLQNSMTNVDLQMHISRDISRYFEMHPSQNVGFVIVKLDKLFNGIINELRDRIELAPFLHFHEREPISRSMKGAFSVLNENSEESGSYIELYIRLSYFGKSIITEIVTPVTMSKAFYAQEETNEKYPYQCRELKAEEIEANSWGSVTLIPPMKPQNFQCDCQTQRNEELLQQKTDITNKMEYVHGGNDQVKNETGDMIQGPNKRKSNSKSENDPDIEMNGANISIKDQHSGKSKKKKLKSRAENNDKTEETDEAEKTDKLNETEKADKIEKSEKAGKTDKAVKSVKIVKAENKRKEDRMDERNEKEIMDKVNKKERMDKTDKKERMDKTDKKEKNDEIDKREKVDKVNEKEKMDKIYKRGKLEKETEKERKTKNEEKDKEGLKVGKSMEKDKIGGKKDDSLKKDKNEEKEQNKNANFKEQGKGRIEANRIKMLRRRNAGPITVGIFEKNIRPCLSIAHPCPCKDCNSLIFYPPSCPVENVFSFIHCPKVLCANNPILPCL